MCQSTFVGTRLPETAYIPDQIYVAYHVEVNLFHHCQYMIDQRQG